MNYVPYLLLAILLMLAIIVWVLGRIEVKLSEIEYNQRKAQHGTKV